RARRRIRPPSPATPSATPTRTPPAQRSIRQSRSPTLSLCCCWRSWRGEFAEGGQGKANGPRSFRFLRIVRPIDEADLPEHVGRTSGKREAACLSGFASRRRFHLPAGGLVRPL